METLPVLSVLRRSLITLLYSSSILILAAVHKLQADPSVACVTNFTVGGSVVRGTTYSSFEYYRGARKHPILDALKQAIEELSFAVLVSDDTAGTVSARGTIGGRNDQDVMFTAEPDPGGVRVSFRHRLGVGTRGRDDEIQRDLCEALDRVTPILRDRILSAVDKGTATASSRPPSADAQAIRGRFLRKDHPGDYLEIGVGMFVAAQDGQRVSGTYEVRGDKIILTTPTIAVPGVGRIVSKDSIQDERGWLWERESILSNENIMNLVKADLGDEIVIAKIKNAPKVQLNVSTDALVSLKKAKVSSAVIAPMIERAERQPPVTSTAPPKPAEYAAVTATAPPNPCAGIELMGLYKEDMRPVSPLIIYIAQVRNSSSVAKIVRVEWLDMYGQPMQSTIQVVGGQIAKVQLAAQEPFQRQPINLKVASCQ